MEYKVKLSKIETTTFTVPCINTLTNIVCYLLKFKLVSK